MSTHDLSSTTAKRTAAAISAAAKMARDKAALLIGRRFERLTVLRISESQPRPGIFFDVRCDCGAEKTIAKTCLLRSSKTSRSCGCAVGESNREKKTTHGKTGTPAYVSWRAMRSRCENPKSQSYRNYGARGITVCERWLDFKNFLADMGEPPPGTSIDRIDNDGNYEPGNCRWATDTQQARNKRNNVMLTLGGRTQAVAAWAEEFEINPGRILARLKYGWDVQSAIVTPPRRFKRGKQGD